ncbi:hypothetical protein DL93DRAFT_1801584 [Clavulina sp. PMI_390]|nr:hypothetical protein DL93DRAFT_1801584 [Clavulina sp. PMI_390]
MRVLSFVATLVLGTLATEGYVTTSTEWADLCYAHITASVATKTQAGVTVTATEPSTAYAVCVCDFWFPMAQVVIDLALSSSDFSRRLPPRSCFTLELRAWLPSCPQSLGSRANNHRCHQRALHQEN